jgi:integrase
VPQIGDECEFVFSTDGVRPLSGYSKFKTLFDEAMAEVAAEECGEPVTIPNWRLHDLRRTFASGCARLGVSLQVVERCLNHSSGSLGGLVAVYNRHSYAAEQADAWQKWAAHVAAVVADDRSNVVPLVPLQVEHVPA